MNKKSLIFLFIGIAIMLIILWFIGLDEIFDALKIANILYIILAILIQVIVYFLFALRWEILNKLTNIDVSLKKLIPIVLVGLAVNNITPSGRGGGEPVRAYILGKEAKKPMEDAFATVITDRTLDTFPFILLAIITIIAMALYFPLNNSILVLMLFALILIIVALILIVYMCININFGNKLTRWVIKIVGRFYKKNSEKLEIQISEVIASFQNTMRIIFSHKHVVFYAIPLSFFIWVMEILRVYVVFLAFGANISPIIIGEVFIIASLIGIIPLLPGGLGAVDGVMILLYSNAGITAFISAAATVIERLISFWLATIIGLIIMPYYGSSVIEKISSLSFNRKKEKKKDLENICDENK